MSFAKRLKKLRMKHHVTQQELADYLNVTRPTIAGYETKGKEPDYRTLMLIASYFQVSADYLITGGNFPESLSISNHSSEPSMGYEDYLLLSDELKPTVANLIEKVNRMDSEDLTRLSEYAELLLYQPKYKNSNYEKE